MLQLCYFYATANAEEEKPFEVPPELNLPDDITPVNWNILVHIQCS